MDVAHSLAVIVVHPDDDAYGCAGSIALHENDPGFKFILVIATDGGTGQIAPGIPATADTLGAWRRGESVRAWEAHGTVPDRHEWLDYPDGRLDEADAAQLERRVLQILLEERPTVVATFGPDGITGHRDHIAIGRAVDAAFHRARQIPGPGLHRLVHGAIRESTFQRWNASRERRGLPRMDPTVEYQLRPVPDEQIDIEVDTTAVAGRIIAGLRAHLSQLPVLSYAGGEAGWERIVGREPMVLAWPPRPAGAPILTDLFEGL